MKIKIDVFSGFLGSGKTTLIKKLINEKLYNENIVIIENEFGEVGIDGSILKKANIEVKEVNAGCICCSISGDFKKALEEVIAKYKPQRIVVETSGVGKLSDVLLVIKNQELKNYINMNMIITVVDVMKYEMYITNFSEFYKNQIINANTIILSRTEKVDNEKLEKIVGLIRLLNDKANIITTNWDKISGAVIVEVSEHDIKHELTHKVNLLLRHNRDSVATGKPRAVKHCAGEVFNTWGIEIPKIFKISALSDILDKLKNNNTYGVVLRAKGIVETIGNGWVQFDYVPDEIQIVNTNPDYTGRISVIGSNLNKDNLKDLFYERDYKDIII